MAWRSDDVTAAGEDGGDSFSSFMRDWYASYGRENKSKGGEGEVGTNGRSLGTEFWGKQMTRVERGA